MIEDLSVLKTLKSQGFSKIEIDQVFNYLETLDYDLKNTSYIGEIVSKNERLAKYFFLRDKFKFDINSSDQNYYIHEILDECIDWSEFWRLLVIKQGFCCIRLHGKIRNKVRFIFLSGPNILSGPSADLSDSIYENMNY
tara:strand:- start:1953 stop:2369 length:417 start_codon:yes stop_codon:yes gene_type:complete